MSSIISTATIVDCDETTPEEAFEKMADATRAPREHVHNLIALRENLNEFLRERGLSFYSSFGLVGIRCIDIVRAENSICLLSVMSPHLREYLDLSKEFSSLIEEWIIEMVNEGLPNRWAERRGIARFQELGLFIEGFVD